MNRNYPAQRLAPAMGAIMAAILAFGGCALPPVDSAAMRDVAASQEAATTVTAEETLQPSESAAAEPDVTAAAEPADAFEQQLAAALAAPDFDALEALMTDSFRMSVFEAEGRIIPAEEAAGELRDLYLLEGATPLIEKQVDLASLLGTDPLTIWGDGAAMADVLFVSGLGGDALGEAVFAIAEESAGEFAWAGALFAPAGFGGRPLLAVEEAVEESVEEAVEEAVEEPVAEEATPEPAPETARIVTIVRMTNVYPAPDPDVAPAGLLRRDDQFTVQGEDESGDYLQIDCGEVVAENCWVVNDPGAVEVSEAPALAEESTPDAETAPEEAAEASPEALTEPPAEPAAQATSEPAPEAQEAAVDVASAEEINFAGMSVAATKSGQATPEEVVAYLVRAKAGQAMTIDLVSDENIANFSIIGAANGQPYKRIANEDRVFVFTVPATQDYVIAIETPSETDYTLTVILPPTGPQGSTVKAEETAASAEATEAAQESAEEVAAPESEVGEAAVVSIEDATRLSLEEGETAVSVTELVSPEGANQYVVRALQGQTMDVGVDSIEDIAQVSVVNVRNGRFLKFSDDGETAWSGTLPATGDYLITIYNTRPVRVQYTLDVAFSPLEGDDAAEADAPAAEEVDAERILFAPGATAEFVSGSVAQGEVVPFVMEAAAGQTLSISFYPTGPATFSVAGADGEVLKSSDENGSFWSSVLPVDQDYIVAIQSEDDDIDFELIIELTD